MKTYTAAEKAAAGGLHRESAYADKMKSYGFVKTCVYVPPGYRDKMLKGAAKARDVVINGNKHDFL